MKKFLPIFILGGLILALTGYLFLKPQAFRDLSPYVKGEVAKFEVFDAPKTLPETPFFNRDGRAMQFSDFKGKTLLVNFWATWCEPCKEEMPTLQNLQTTLGGDKFEVITISIDWQGFPIMDPFFEEYGITEMAAYWDNSGRLPNELETIGLPLTILISPDGKWVGRMDGPLVWDSPDAIALFRAATPK